MMDIRGRLEALRRYMAEEDLEHFRAGVLWAIGRLGSLAGEHAADVLPAILAALDMEALLAEESGSQERQEEEEIETDGDE